MINKDSFCHLVREWADKYTDQVKNDKFKQVTPHTFRRSYWIRKDLEGIDRKAVATNMGHHSLATSEIYNVMDENRVSSVAGFTTNTREATSSLIEQSLIENGKKEGLSLNQLQTKLRKSFLASKKKFQN